MQENKNHLYLLDSELVKSRSINIKSKRAFLYANYITLADVD